MDTVARLHQNLIALLDSIGEYRTELKKDSIHVVRDRAFIGVHPKK